MKFACVGYWCRWFTGNNKEDVCKKGRLFVVVHTRYQINGTLPFSEQFAILWFALD